PEAPATPVVRTLYLGVKIEAAFDLAGAVRGEDSDWSQEAFTFASSTGMLADLTFDVKVSDMLLVGVYLGFLYAGAESPQHPSDQLGLFDLGCRLGMILSLADSVDVVILMGMGASMLMSELKGNGRDSSAALVAYDFGAGYIALNLRLALAVNWFFLENLGLSFEAGTYFALSGESNAGVAFDFGPLVMAGLGIVYSL
ncbi:MAG TPA: hypothetical protein P5076_24795, partial [Myxococcota bacterium]|nr:hypothetical protein [Myxococcota bacterium]